MTVEPLNRPYFAKPTKRKVFISYHHGSDQRYYDEFSRIFADGYEAVQDNSLDRLFDSDDADYVIRQIREQYISGTSCTIVLCGPQTRWRKFVDWEIKASLDMKHGLIGINLPNNPSNAAGRVYTPARLHDNIGSNYAVWTSWENLLAGPDYLRQCIEVANGKEKRLIQNTRPLRRKNGI